MCELGEGGPQRCDLVGEVQVRSHYLHYKIIGGGPQLPGVAAFVCLSVRSGVQKVDIVLLYLRVARHESQAFELSLGH